MNFKAKTSQKIISTFLIIFIILPSILFFVPKNVNAQFTGPCYILAPTGTDSCAGYVPATVTAKATFWSQIWNGTTQVKTSISAGTDLKQWALKIAQEAIRNIMKKLMQKMTESTVNWINSGFHGAPLYVENPGSFFGDIAKYEIRNLVGQIGNNDNKYPFGKSFLTGIINSYKTTLAQNAQYSLSKVTNDPELLQNSRVNFSTGGWDGFLLTSQFPQNNQLGSQMIYQNYLNAQLAGTVQNKADEVKDILKQGQGFLSPQTCPSNPAYNNALNEFNHPEFKPTTPPPVLQDCSIYETCNTQTCSANGIYSDGDPVQLAACNDANAKAQEAYQLDSGSEKLVWDQKNSCPGGLVNTTPGSVVANQIMTSMSSPFRQGELGIAMGNSLSAIFDALINHFLSAGLNGLTSKSKGSTSKSNDTFDWGQAPDAPLNIDDLNYDGTKFIDGQQPPNSPGLQYEVDPTLYPDTNPTIKPPAPVTQ